MEHKDALIAEWNESRKTIARFDGYLLKLRILAISVFSILLIIAIGLLRADPQNSVLIESSLLTLTLIFLYICVVFMLDRYYERMLMIAVNRASRLEAIKLHRFKIGLTTEIEIGKNTPSHSVYSKFASAGKTIVIVYAIIFSILATAFLSILLTFEEQLIFYVYIHWLILAFLIGIGCSLIFISNKIMSPPLTEAKLRSKVANSPLILSHTDIANCISNIASSIKDWTEGRQIHLVCILNGARNITDDLVKELENNCRVSYIKAKATSGTALLSSVHFEYGSISSPKDENEPILIIDDLVDSGKTLKEVSKHISSLGYKNIKSAALLNKYANTEVADFIGFDLALDKQVMASAGINDYWLFGYGMDIDGHYRDLDYIGWIEVKNA